MAIEGITSTAEADVIPVSTTQPAPGADDQKPIPPAGDENAAEPATETTEQQEARKQSKFQRRLERQKNARIAAETETRLLREQIAKLEAQKQPSQEAVEPKRDDFENLEDYLRAISKYEAEQVTKKELKAEREARQGEASRTRENAGEARIAKEWQERETAFMAATKGYQETVTAYIEDEVGQLSDVARRSILESEVGPNLLHYLAKNPDEAERIAELSPVRQVAELGKLETKLSPAARKASSAPAPITPVGNSGSTSTKKLAEMTQDEFDKARRKQIAQRR